jgi:hypothetical protein
VEQDIQQVVRHVLRQIGKEQLSAAKRDDAFPYSAVPLCVIDAVFSIQAVYIGTWRTVSRWAHLHKWEMCKWRAPDRHFTSDFLNIIAPYGDRFNDIAEVEFCNSQRLVPAAKTSITKAEGVVRFTRVLKDFGIETLGDALKLGWSSKLRSEIEKIPGHSTGTIHNYFMMLIGDNNAVKADSMITRFVANALGLKNVQPPRAENAVREAAKALKAEFPNLTPSLLYQRVYEASFAIQG